MTIVTRFIFSPKLWKEVGRRVRAAREETGCNLSTFALTIRTTKQGLDQLERGTMGVRLEVLYRVARATHRPIADLLPPIEDT